MCPTIESVQVQGKQADPWQSQWARTDVPTHVWESHTEPEVRYVNPHNQSRNTSTAAKHADMLIKINIITYNDIACSY